MPFAVFFAAYILMCVLGIFYCFTLPIWCWVMEWLSLPCTFKEACIWNGVIALAPILFFAAMAWAYYGPKKAAAKKDDPREQRRKLPPREAEPKKLRLRRRS